MKSTDKNDFNATIGNTVLAVRSFKNLKLTT